MEDAQYFAEKAQQCRRLLRATDDPRTVEVLTALANEFDGTAKAIEAFNQTAPSIDDGVAGRLAPDHKGNPK